MKKILFLIHDLGPGGAEKVLINLVNNLDKNKYDVTLLSLFDVGINKKYINNDVKYKYVFKKMFRGNSHLFKLFSAKFLHNVMIKDSYDVEVAFLEGPCSRIISGCTDNNTKIVSWIHIQQFTKKRASMSFRSYKEALSVYNRFDLINCVSEEVKKDFMKIMPVSVPVKVLYNINETQKILDLGKKKIEENLFTGNIRLVGVGKLLRSKGFDRLINICNMLNQEKINVDMIILGEGPEEKNLKTMINEYNLNDNIRLLGYQANPYKYMSKCDLFVCASYREGFSTAATEALVLGLPICTVDVAGMKEMLGYNNEYGVVTKNDDESLYRSIKTFVTDFEYLKYYKMLAEKRGKMFSKDETLKKVEEMIDNI